MVTTEEEDSAKVKEEEEAKHSTEAVSDMDQVVLECTKPDCSFGDDGAKYKTPKLKTQYTLRLRLLVMHVCDNHLVPVPVGNGQQQVRPEKVQRPKLVVKDGYVTDEAFDYFEHAWREYKTLASVNTAVKQHLSSCLGEEVLTMVYNTYGEMGYDALDEAALLKAARCLVVKTRNKLVM